MVRNHSFVYCRILAKYNKREGLEHQCGTGLRRSNAQVKCVYEG